MVVEWENSHISSGQEQKFTVPSDVQLTIVDITELGTVSYNNLLRVIAAQFFPIHEHLYALNWHVRRSQIAPNIKYE